MKSSFHSLVAKLKTRGCFRHTQPFDRTEHKYGPVSIGKDINRPLQHNFELFIVCLHLRISCHLTHTSHDVKIRI